MGIKPSYFNVQHKRTQFALFCNVLTGVCFGVQIVHQVVAGTVFMNQRILGFENNRLTLGNTIRYTVEAFFFRDYILGRFSRKNTRYYLS